MTHLEITNGLVEPELLARLGRLPFAAKLRSLALTNVELSDNAIPLLSNAGLALSELDVSDNELTGAGLAAARPLAATVISRRQYHRASGQERRVRQFAGGRLQAAEGIADPSLWRQAWTDGAMRWAHYRGDDEYDLYVSADLKQFGCSCPSRYQPCKHVVALALVAERHELPRGQADEIQRHAWRGSRGGVD